MLGNTAEIPQLVSLHDVGLILYAIENIRPAQRDRILHVCRSSGAQTVILPDVLETLRDQLANRPAEPSSPTSDVDNTQLEQWLSELDGLIEAEAWDTARERIQDMQQMMLLEAKL